VDVPRLAVGVYATSVSTALFFAQAVGRFVRARQRGETASVFLPSVPVLLALAAELEAERDHVVRALDRDPEAELDEAQRERKTPDDFELVGKSIEVLKASAVFDRVLFDGGEFGTAAEAGSPGEEDFLGLPGLLEPDQVAVLLRKRQAAQLAARSAAAPAGKAAAGRPEAADAGLFTADPVRPAGAARVGGAPAATATSAPARPVATVSREQLAALRKELNGLVGAWSHRTGQPHGVIHNELRSSCGGPALPQASADQIKARIDKIRQWALSRRLRVGIAGPLGAGDLHAGVAKRRDRLGGGPGGDAGGEAEQDAGGEALRGGIHRGGPHAVVRRDPGDVDLVHVAVAEPVRERRAVVVDALEPAVGGGVRALAEDRLDRPGHQVGMEVGAARAGDAVRRPGMRVVRLVREVAAGADVVVLSGHHMVVAVLAAGQQRADGTGHRGPAGDRE
jgi:hypothetical protein